MTYVAQMLASARELITPPQHWTQGTLARTLTGAAIRPTNQEATCFCAMGAIRKVTQDYYSCSPVLDALADVTPGGQIGDFNDTHTHAEVLALFDAAIAAERKKAGDA